MELVVEREANRAEPMASSAEPRSIYFNVFAGLVANLLLVYAGTVSGVAEWPWKLLALPMAIVAGVLLGLVGIDDHRRGVREGIRRAQNLRPLSDSGDSR